MLGKHTIRGRIFKGIGANAFGQLITIVIQILSVPLFLHYWGAVRYGEWLVLSAVPSYLSMSDIGFGSVAANEMTMLHARGELESSRTVFHSGISLVSMISLFVIGVVTVVAFSFDVSNILHIKTQSAKIVASILVVLSIQVGVGLITGMVAGGFRASGGYAQSIVLSNLIRLFEWISCVICLVIGGGPLSVAISGAIVRFLGMFIIIIILWKKSRIYHFGFSDASFTVIRALMVPALGFMAFPAGLALNLQGTTLIIGVVMGPLMVTIFSAYRTYSRLLIQFLTILNQALWPEISRVHGNGDTRATVSLIRNSVKISFVVSLLGAILIGLFGKFVILHWTGFRFGFDPLLLWLLISVAAINVLWQPQWVGLMACNLHGRLSLKFIIVNLITIISLVFVSRVWGVYGAACSLLLCEIVLLFVINHFDNYEKYLKEEVGCFSIY